MQEDRDQTQQSDSSQSIQACPLSPELPVLNSGHKPYWISFWLAMTSHDAISLTARLAVTRDLYTYFVKLRSGTSVARHVSGLDHMQKSRRGLLQGSATSHARSNHF